MAVLYQGADKMNMTPGRAVRLYCLDCVGLYSYIKECQGDRLFDKPCMLYKYRMGKGRPSVKMIRKYCLDCMGNSAVLVSACHSKGCMLHKYRFGKNPEIKARGCSLKSPRNVA